MHWVCAVASLLMSLCLDATALQVHKLWFYSYGSNLLSSKSVKHCCPHSYSHTQHSSSFFSFFTTVNSIHWKHTKQRYFICWRHSKTHWLHLWHKTLDTEKWHFSAERLTPPHHQNPHWHPRRPPMALCCLTLSEYRCLCEDKDGVFSTCSLVISFKVSIHV